jgi:hypothetical protein
LFHIKQSGSVQAYINSFSELVDQLVTYEHLVVDQRYFTSCFADGLKDNIKSIVLVQRPIDLDSAYTLALLQEEAESGCRKEFRKAEFMHKPKPLPQEVALPLQLPPPPKADKAASTSMHTTGHAGFISAMLKSGLEGISVRLWSSCRLYRSCGISCSWTRSLKLSVRMENKRCNLISFCPWKQFQLVVLPKH